MNAGLTITRAPRSLRFAALLAIPLIALATPARAVTFVSLSGNDSLGESWETALHDVGQAVESGDGEVWVAAGTYPIDEAIDVPDNVVVLGGFPDTGVAILSDRDPAQFETVLDAELVAGNIFVCDGTTGATIDGFTMTRALGDGPGFGRGGAIVCRNDANVTITQCLFVNNNIDSFGGGGINVFNDAFATVTKCRFTNNSGQEGGAIKLHQAGIVVSDCHFEGNTSSLQGGAIGVYDSTVEIGNSVFINNESDFGGALECHEGRDSIVYNCVFFDNEAEVRGGAIAFAFENDTSAINCTFVNNRAQEGGGVSLVSISGAMANNIFAENTNQAVYEGNNSADVSCVSNLFFNNPDGVYLDEGTTLITDVSGALGLNTLVAEAADNRSGNPRFIRRTATDFRLRLASPAIDNADDFFAPPTDIAAIGRPFDVPGFGQDGEDVGCDIGAHELENDPADVNRDLIINIFDLQFVVNAILTELISPNTFPDTTEDEIVNIFDVQDVVSEILSL